jgi:hypothetical protein
MNDIVENSQATADSMGSFLFSRALASEDQLGSCDASKQGYIYHLASSGQFKSCDGQNWSTVNITTGTQTKKSFLLKFELSGRCYPGDHVRSTITTGDNGGNDQFGSSFLVPKNGVLKNLAIKKVGKNDPIYGNDSIVSSVSGLYDSSSLIINGNIPENSTYDTHAYPNNYFVSYQLPFFNDEDQFEVAQGDIVGFRVWHQCNNGGGELDDYLNVGGYISTGNVLMTVEYEYEE